MERLVRFGVSLEEGLLRRFDGLLRRCGYGNRSKAIADLVRERLVEEEWRAEGEVVGIISMLYDHHQRELSNRLTHVQHDHYTSILSSQHIHLDRDMCLEVVVARGRPGEIRRIADLIRASRGVKHVRLSMSSTGKKL
ncbi:MAG: nickel-responsive transcriptional regulator NikR [bacterium]|nr:nickel-responsive transcriptional regulator NikR [bacterium]